MKNIIDEAIKSNMKPNTIDSLLFLNHVINQMIDLEKLNSNRKFI